MPTEKLIRDKIPEIVRKKGETLKTRKGKKKEIREIFLPQKLREELEEALSAPTKKKKIEEWGDFFEALDEHFAESGISMVKVHSAQQRKRKEKGGFSKRTILIEDGKKRGA